MGQVGTISLTKADRFAATRDISGEIVTEKGTNKSRTLPRLVPLQGYHFPRRTMSGARHNLNFFCG
jgi:hypothetical protein